MEADLRAASTIVDAQSAVSWGAGAVGRAASMRLLGGGSEWLGIR